MHVVGHHHKRIQFNVRVMVGHIVPCPGNDLPTWIHPHLASTTSPHTQAVLRDNRDTIHPRLGVIVSLRTDAAAVVFKGVVGAVPAPARLTTCGCRLQSTRRDPRASCACGRASSFHAAHAADVSALAIRATTPFHIKSCRPLLCQINGFLVRCVIRAGNGHERSNTTTSTAGVMPVMCLCSHSREW